MNSWTVLLSLSLVAVCHAQFFNGGFPGGGFSGGGFPGGGGGFQKSRGQKFHNKFENAAGNSAAAGDASALQGDVTSINQANHEAGGGRTRSNAISANTGSGIGVHASGAAQAGGQTSRGVQRGSNFERQQGFFRRKRQAWGFPGFGFGSGSNANALGGGSAMFGNVETNNMANTFSNPWGASGFGAGNARGSGYGVNIWNAATSNSFSGGRKKRQAWGFPGGFNNGFGGFGSSGSNANALGGANTMFGNAFTNNNAFTNSNPWGASGSAFGNAGADGPGANAWNAATSNSFSNGF